MKKTIIFLSVLSLLAASRAYAEEASLGATVETKPLEVRTEVRAKPDAKMIRAELKNQIEAKKAALKAEATSTRTAIRGDREDLKEFRGLASTTKADFEAKKDAIKSDIEARKEALKEKRDETRTEIKDIVSQKISNVVANAIERLNEALERLAKVRDAIESRLAKFEAKGVNTVAARADFETAKTKLSQANITISALASTSVSTSTKGSIQAFKDAAKKAQTSVQEAHQSFQKVISDMKGYEAQIKATTTAEVR